MKKLLIFLILVLIHLVVKAQDLYNDEHQCGVEGNEASFVFVITVNGKDFTDISLLNNYLFYAEITRSNSKKTKFWHYSVGTASKEGNDMTVGGDYEVVNDVCMDADEEETIEITKSIQSKITPSYDADDNSFVGFTLTLVFLDFPYAAINPEEHSLYVKVFDKTKNDI